MDLEAMKSLAERIIREGRFADEIALASHVITLVAYIEERKHQDAADAAKIAGTK
jgi:hypothetical protein